MKTHKSSNDILWELAQKTGVTGAVVKGVHSSAEDFPFDKSLVRHQIEKLLDQEKVDNDFFASGLFVAFLNDLDMYRSKILKDVSRETLRIFLRTFFLLFFGLGSIMILFRLVL